MNSYEITVYEPDGEIGVTFVTSFVLNIIQDINRPNNPENYEIIDTYMMYNYGKDFVYSCEELEDTVLIDSNWNIENYR